MVVAEAELQCSGQLTPEVQVLVGGSEQACTHRRWSGVLVLRCMHLQGLALAGLTFGLTNGDVRRHHSLQGMLAYARKQEGVLAAALEQQQPRFLANATGGTKRCRGAPAGHEVPRLHRVGLLLPPGTRQRAAAAAAAAKQPRRRQLLLNTDALAAAALRSAAGGGPASGSRPADISVVTQLSLDRLPALARQCASWRGPLIAVVYAPLVGGRVALLLEQAHVAAAADPRLAALDGGTPLEALQYVRAQHRRISSRPGGTGGGGGNLLGRDSAQPFFLEVTVLPSSNQQLPSPSHALTLSCSPCSCRPLTGGCQLTLELVVEERCSLPLAGLWPINANRNRALMLADTPAVALLDVDFLVAGQLSPWLGEQPAGDGIGGGTGSSTASSSSQGDHRQVGETPRDTSSSSSSSSSSGVALAMGQQLTGSGGGAAAAARSTATGMVRRLAAALYASEAALRGSSPDDAWLAALLADGEAQGRSWLEAVLSQNAAVVLPAFEANTTSLGRGIRATLAAAMASKAGMAALVTERRLCSFQQRQYPRGHHATRVRWWVRTQEPYAVDYWQVGPGEQLREGGDRCGHCA